MHTTVEAALPELLRLARCSLEDLIRIDTSNPPGGELRAAQYLAARLAMDGVECQVFEPEPGRGNLIARLPAATSASEGPLVLLAHLDCLPFNRGDWQHGPLDADVADGAIWGRGAVNCKGSLAVWGAILARLSRLNLPRRRDVVFVAAADALTGWTWGMSWIQAHHPDCLIGDAALAQGGGWPLHVFGKTYYTYQCSEKGIATARLVAHRAPGITAKGTVNSAGTAEAAGQLFLLGRALSILERLDLPAHVTPCFQAFVEALAAPQPLPASSHIRSLLSPLLAGEAVRRVAADPMERSVLLALARNTVSPTMVAGGTGWLRATSNAEIVLDCRMLPGQTVTGLCGELRAALHEEGVPLTHAGEGFGIEVLCEEVVSPTESSPEAGLVALMGQAIAKRQPGAYLVPLMSANPTSNRFARMAGTPSYGFFPTLPDVDLSGAHGANERLPLASLKFAVEVLWDVVVNYVCGVM